MATPTEPAGSDRTQPEWEDYFMMKFIQTYQYHCPNEILELNSEPSPLQFMRYVAANVPFVIRGGAKEWTACKEWNADYLRKSVRDSLVKVALTVDGRADAVYFAPDSTGKVVKCIMEPLDVYEPFDIALRAIQNQGSLPSPPECRDRVIRYMQTQNDNLRGEFLNLSHDVPKDIPFARIALEGKEVDSINLWIGNSQSRTVFHKDNFENILVQIVGTKTVLLVPPSETACLNEEVLPYASYQSITCSACHYGSSCGYALPLIHGDVFTAKVVDPRDASRHSPFPTWDPYDRTAWSEPSRFSHACKPTKVTVQEGDMLYVPTQWYHAITQEPNMDKGGICVSVNYWYDMNFDSHLWPSVGFIRDLALKANDTGRGTHHRRLPSWAARHEQRPGGQMPIPEQPDEAPLMAQQQTPQTENSSLQYGQVSILPRPMGHTPNGETPTAQLLSEEGVHHRDFQEAMEVETVPAGEQSTGTQPPVTLPPGLFWPTASSGEVTSTSSMPIGQTATDGQSRTPIGEIGVVPAVQFPHEYQPMAGQPTTEQQLRQ